MAEKPGTIVTYPEDLEWEASGPLDENGKGIFVSLLYGDLKTMGPANFLKFARQVTMLVRGKALSDSMSQYLEDQIAATKNIEVRLNSSVIAVEGADRCETITVQNNRTRATEKVSASALLIYAGAVPHTDWLTGDVRHRSAKGVTSGVGEGAMAVKLVHQYLGLL